MHHTLSGKTLQRFLTNLQDRNIEIRAMTLFQNGEKRLERYWAPFRKEELFPVYSVTKSFLCVLIGWLMEEGSLCLDDIWLSYFPEYAEEADPAFRKITIRHMLTMSMGQAREAPVKAGEDLVKQILREPVVCEPGTVFFYNSMISYLLGILVQKITGRPLTEELEERILSPLGITEYSFETEIYGNPIAGMGLHLKHADMARFGLAMLNGGIYGDRRICPESWAEAVGKKQFDNAPFYPPENTENRAGYGFHFWGCSRGGYRCSGLYGQLCYIWPEKSLVLAANSATGSNGMILSCLYDAMDAGETGTADEKEKSAESAEIYGNMGTAEAEYGILPFLSGEKNGTGALRFPVSAVPEENPWGIQQLSLSETEGTVLCTIIRQHKTYTFAAGFQKWHGQPDAFTAFTPFAAEEVMDPVWHRDFHAPELFANYAWEDEMTLCMQIRAIDFSGRPAFRFTFSDDRIDMQYRIESYLTTETEITLSFTI